MQPDPLGNLPLRCGCCNQPDVRVPRVVRWVIRGTSFWSEHSLIRFYVCPTCDRLTASETK